MQPWKVMLPVVRCTGLVSLVLLKLEKAGWTQSVLVVIRTKDKGTGEQGRFQSPGQCDPLRNLPCQCPLRTNVEAPERLPIATVLEHGKKLEERILK